MAFVSEPRFLVLHGLRLKGFCGAEQLADMVALTPGDTTKLLEDLKDDALVLLREGRMSGWALTPGGRAEHGRLITEEMETAACRDEVDGAYHRFLEINASLLGVCTDWQMRTVGGDQVLNDHADAEYDGAVITRLREVDDAVQPVCAELSQHLARFAGYGPRLSGAVDKVAGGELDWFTKPLIDSYHTVWFELHEDLLVTLGIERAKEGQQ